MVIIHVQMCLSNMISLLRICLGVLLFQFSQGFVFDSLACSHCTNEQSLSNCRGFINCKDTEKFCFLQMTNHGTSYTYTTGCMTGAVCQRLAGVDAGGNCIKCCNSTLCNNDSKLCGLTAATATTGTATSPSTTATSPITTATLASATAQSTTPMSFGPQCYSCSNLTNPSDCHRSMACFKNEACLLEALQATDGTVTYHGSCAKRQECPTITGKKRYAHIRHRSDNPLNRREATLCYECCDSDFCNRHLCGSVSTAAAVTTPLQTTPSTTIATAPTTSTAPRPCVDNPNVNCAAVKHDVCGKDDHFTLDLCRRTCGSCH